MIVRNYAEHWIGCDICEDLIELSRRIRQNPETVLIMIEEMQSDHRDCEQYKHDPRTAKLHRGYKVRMREEIARANGGGHDRRRAA